MEEILPNLFRMEIPLPDNPLQYLNSYVIRAQERNLVVDTGMNLKVCEEAMMAGLKALGIDLQQTDFFITHLHVDHFGLLPKLAGEKSRVYMGRKELETIETWPGWKAIVHQAEIHGFPGALLKQALGQVKGFDVDTQMKLSPLPVDPGQIIAVGPYRFQCVSTPGHSIGHTCLWEPSEKVLIAGDHILEEITPNIHCWFEGQNPLKQYLESLETVAAMPVETVLPGHRRVFARPGPRIKTLISHHSRRCGEILDLLKGRMLTPFEIASKTSWGWADLQWADLPVLQQWFAIGETIAHLQFLEADHLIARTKSGGKIRFDRPEKTY